MKASAAFPLRRALLDTAVLTALAQYLFLAMKCFQGAVHFSTQPGLKVNTLPRWFNQAEFNEVKWGESPLNFSKIHNLVLRNILPIQKVARKDTLYKSIVQKTGKLSKGPANFTRRKLDLQVKAEWKPCNEIRNKWRCLTLTWKGLNQTQHHSEDSSTCHLPTQDNNEVHHIPAVPQVRALVECKSQSNDFYSSFKAKHSYEVGLCFFLRKEYRLDVRQQKLP